MSVLLSVSAAAADSTTPIRLAAPGFTGVNIDDKVANFFSEHFAQKLSLKGISVISASEVKTLVGLERQRQMMGCDESSCLAELANAMGADGVITGSIGKFGTTFQVNIKILSASNASALSIISKKAYGEEDLLTLLDESAADAAVDLKEKLGRTGTSPVVERETPRESVREEVPASGSPTPAPPPATAAKQTRPNNLTLGVAGLLGGVAALEYERAVLPWISLFAQPGILYGEFWGFEMVVGARAYPFGLAPEGFFLGFDGRFNTTEVTYGMAASGSLGYTARLANVITLSVGVNAGYYFEGMNPNLLFGPIDFSFRGHAGFAF